MSDTPMQEWNNGQVLSHWTASRHGQGYEYKELMGEQIMRFPSALGVNWVPLEPQDEVAACTALGKLYDKEVFDMIAINVPDDAVIIDLGAHLGQMSQAFARHAARGWVHAVEAHPMIYEVMAMNFAENNVKNITAYHRAIWDTADKELFYPREDYARWRNRSSFGIEPLAAVSPHGHVVQSMTVDELNLPRVDAIKIDVQGSDLAAMRGAVETIKRCRPIIVFELESYITERWFQEKASDYLDFVADIGYTVVEIYQHNYLIAPEGVKLKTLNLTAEKVQEKDGENYFL
jgi:FkbM family methyltransferase